MPELTSNLSGFAVSTEDTSTKTSKGTSIVRGGQNTLDKNSFLKILTAELGNQNPLNSDNDPTKYISQLASFSSLEQMANLNGTMSLNSASNLIGKKVTFKDLNDQNENYQGIISSVAKDGDTINLNFNVVEGGQEVTKTLNYNNVISVEQDSSGNTSTGLSNTLRSTSSS